MKKSNFIMLSVIMLMGQKSLTAASESHPLIVHEWGTFTSVQGSNGEVLSGMHHEEEHLPAFVHGRDALHEFIPLGISCRSMKCLDVPQSKLSTVLPVTQKMETPVIYFYSDREQKVNVQVSFPNGIISQYFPMPTTFSPPIGTVSELKNGEVNFDVSLTKKPPELPQVDVENIYGKARNVNSDYLSSEKENEKFIFYRGLGNFKTTFQAKSKNGALDIQNTSKNGYPSLFLVNVTPQGGAIRALGSLNGGAHLTLGASSIADFKSNQMASAEFLNQADQLLTEALENTGLYPDEAKAMTETWKSSYFKNVGLRVLYILPREETDQILPIKVQPIPNSLIRTLVGRVEILLDTEEEQLLTKIREQKKNFDVLSLGRFADPKLRRILQIATSSQDQKLLNDLIDSLTS